MKNRLLVLACVLAMGPAMAQQGPGRVPPDRHHDRQMPAPDRRLGWEERQRLREQVRNGEMSRDEARQRWHEERGRRESEGGRSHADRERLRRDVMDFSPRK